MSIQTRIQQLEKTRPPGNKFLCVIVEYANDDSGPHAPQPYKAQAIGGGSDLIFSTREELETFGARPDVNLEIVNVIIEYASAQDNPGQNDEAGKL